MPHRILPSQLTSLWRNVDFMKLWTAQAISVFGSTITRDALPLAAILTLTATPAQVGLLSALGMAPVLVLGLPTGVWVDRVRRRPILIAADLGRALILVSIPIAALLGALSMPQLYLAALLAGTLTLFFNVADNSFLPSVVKRENLVEANSKLGLTDSLSEIIAPAITGGLVGLITAPLTILVDTLSYLVSAFFLGLIRTPETPSRPTDRPESLRGDILTGLRLVGGDPILRALAGSSGAFAFFGGFIGALYGIYAIRVLGLTPAVLGLLISTGGVGALLGALLAGRLARRFGPGPTLTGSFFVMGLATLLIPLAAGQRYAVAMLAMGQLVGDTALAVYFIHAVSLRQTVTPDHLLGRMNASFEFLVTGIGPLGLLLGGALGQALGVRSTLLIAALGELTGCLWLVLSPVLKLRAFPQQD
jgi:MFS family permease